ncbi:MAG: amidohydrolase family protein, partial [Flavihumibacter sp.]
LGQHRARGVAGIPLRDVIQMATLTPATIMGVQGETGSLVPGKYADIVLFDDHIHVHSTMVKGNIIYQAS